MLLIVALLSYDAYLNLVVIDSDGLTPNKRQVITWMMLTCSVFVIYRLIQ